VRCIQIAARARLDRRKPNAGVDDPMQTASNVIVLVLRQRCNRATKPAIAEIEPGRPDVGRYGTNAGPRRLRHAGRVSIGACPLP
jgi:hypothetical protein